MIFKDLFKETYSALLMNKARSGLTVLGIVIGIGSVIALVAIGQGATSSIESSIESLGSNLVMVTPGAQKGIGVRVSSGRGSAQSLTTEDVEEISKLLTAKTVAPVVTGQYQVTAKGTNTRTSVVGVTSAYAAMKTLEIEEGVFISEQNNKSSSKVAVIGPTVRDDLFGEEATSVMGQNIRINNIIFKIVGVTVAKGASGMSNADDMIYIPLSTSQRFLSGNEYLSTINVEATDKDSMSVLETEISSLLLDLHNITDSANADFSVTTQEDMIESASSISETLSMLLGGIAAISLIVGGIGIMNMMLTTVTERTREIGLRKAIGAKRKDISIQFLVEAVMLTFIGGIIGVILGSSAAFILNYFDIISTQVSLFSVLLAFGVSAAIGIIFGYYPARRASNLNPIEALRYE
jgi:putative ABC transport system permease protein